MTHEKIVSLTLDRSGLRAVLIAVNLAISLTHDKSLRERWTTVREGLKGLARAAGWHDVVAELLASETEEEQEERVPS